MQCKKALVQRSPVSRAPPALAGFIDRRRLSMTGFAPQDTRLNAKAVSWEKQWTRGQAVSERADTPLRLKYYRIP